MPTKEIRLLGSHDKPFNGKVFLVTDGQRRWAAAIENLESHGYDYGRDVEWVPAVELDKYKFAGDLPIRGRRPGNLTALEMREYLAEKHLSGHGVEFGAATCPLPVPIDVKVDFADLFILKPEDSRYYKTASAEHVEIKYQTSFDKMEGIANESLDFLVGCHVIEHTRVPLQVIKLAWEKLKYGGKLFLVVPHRDYTFDSKREITPLEHFIKDYKEPSLDRDILHYVEFFTQAFPVDTVADVHRFIRSCYENPNADVHYHTWNTESFREMVQWFSNNVYPWKIDMHDIVKHPDAYEFYAVLTKQR